MTILIFIVWMAIFSGGVWLLIRWRDEYRAWRASRLNLNGDK